MIFLIEYDRPRGVLSSIKAFEDDDRFAAENERLKRELHLHRKRVHHEVVLLQAKTEAALRQTHRRYFVDVAALADTQARSISS